MARKIWCWNRENNELYPANKKMIVANVASHFGISDKEAEGKIKEATVENPIKLYDVDVYMEV